MNLSGFFFGAVSSFYGHGYKPSVSVKCGEFLCLTGQLPKKGLTPWSQSLYVTCNSSVYDEPSSSRWIMLRVTFMLSGNIV
jgi:hypothetical protein